MEETSDIIIPFNSNTYNRIFFKKHERKELLLLIHKNYLKYKISPFDEHLTLKINSSRRVLVFNRFIDSILDTILSRYLLNDVKKTIKYYIGCGIDNVYIEDKTWINLLNNLKINFEKVLN